MIVFVCGNCGRTMDVSLSGRRALLIRCFRCKRTFTQKDDSDG